MTLIQVVIALNDIALNDNRVRTRAPLLILDRSFNFWTAKSRQNRGYIKSRSYFIYQRSLSPPIRCLYWQLLFDDM